MPPAAYDGRLWLESRLGHACLEVAGLVEAQRAYRLPIDPNMLTSAAGSFAQLTTVTADAITTKIIHRWPDEIRKALGE